MLNMDVATSRHSYADVGLQSASTQRSTEVVLHVCTLTLQIWIYHSKAHHPRFLAVLCVFSQVVHKLWGSTFMERPSYYKSRHLSSLCHKYTYAFDIRSWMWLEPYDEQSCLSQDQRLKGMDMGFRWTVRGTSTFRVLKADHRGVAASLTFLNLPRRWCFWEHLQVVPWRYRGPKSFYPPPNVMNRYRRVHCLTNPRKLFWGVAVVKVLACIF